jgi:transposase-like protein
MELTKNQKKKLDKFLKFIESGDTVGMACKKMGITIGTYQSWRRKYSSFGAATKHLTLNNELVKLKESALNSKEADIRIRVINVLNEAPNRSIKEICQEAGISLTKFYAMYVNEEFRKVFDKYKEFGVEYIKSLAYEGLEELVEARDKDMIKFALKGEKVFSEKVENTIKVEQIKTIEIETVKRNERD